MSRLVTVGIFFAPQVFNFKKYKQLGETTKITDFEMDDNKCYLFKPNHLKILRRRIIKNTESAAAILDNKNMTRYKAAKILNNANMTKDKAALILDSTLMDTDKAAWILSSANMNNNKAAAILDSTLMDAYKAAAIKAVKERQAV